MIQFPKPQPDGERNIWRDRAIQATSDHAATLAELAALETRCAELQAERDRIANQPALVLADPEAQKETEALKGQVSDLRAAVLARSTDLAEIHEVLAAFLGVTSPAGVRQKLQAMMAPQAAPPALRPPGAPMVYRPLCRTCREHFESTGPQAKKCPTCKDAEAGTAKPARPIAPPPPAAPKGKPGRKPKAATQAKPKAAKPPDEDDEDAPIVPQKPIIACAGCVHAKRNKDSETGWECTISRYRDCMPWTFAHLKKEKP